MFITNMTNNKLGVTNKVVLKPAEVNHFVDDNDPVIVARVSRLERAKLLSVVRSTGITKTGIKGAVVKTIFSDPDAVKVKTSGVEADATENKVVNEDGSSTTTKRRRKKKDEVVEVPEA